MSSMPMPASPFQPVEPWVLPLDAAPPPAGGHWLGGAVFGAPRDVGDRLVRRIGARAAAACAVVDMMLLTTASGFAELWRVRGEGPVTHGQHGEVTWSADGTLLFAHLTLDEQAFGGGARSALEEAARAAYSCLFGLLQASGYRHPIRFWNYLPRLNADEAGLERYRHFNVGRHAAFLAARRPPDAAPPAACALGCSGTAMTVMVLAGRSAPTAIENPRQVSAYRYPQQYGPRPPTFSRAALHRHGPHALLSISGTASIVGHETLHIGNVAAQVDESLRNVQAVVEAANAATGEAIFAVERLKMKAYVRHADDADTVRHRLQQRLPDTPVPLVRADICRADLLFEIEAAASATLRTPA
jgi:enamine deaminase RidA (YjgF/YER057c/UK114 family)